MFLRGKPSINRLPFDVTNNNMIAKPIGNIPISIIFGGKELVSVL